MFIAALFTIARTWKQPNCPSTDEWVEKMWHKYTMEYYSAIKRNEIELFVVRWMDLESVIQSEVSQIEKNKYRMLTHIYGIKKKKKGSEEPRGRTGIKTQMQRMDLRAQGGRRVNWDKVREWHGHIYTTKCKTDSQWEAAAQHREISLVLCDHLEGWHREGGKEMQERGDICICIAYSLCYTAETNTTL